MKICLLLIALTISLISCRYICPEKNVIEYVYDTIYIDTCDVEVTYDLKNNILVDDTTYCDSLNRLMKDFIDKFSKANE